MVKRRRHTSGNGTKFLIIVILLIVGVIGYSIFTLMNPTSQAKNVVESFYTYEQNGAFSDSWEMFHPLMKQRFSKSHYIQDRAHVFMNHFGVTTFSYSLSSPSKEENWKMTADADEAAILETVYKVEVTQTFKGKYGHFDIQQNVFVAKDEEGDWGILWDYKK